MKIMVIHVIWRGNLLSVLHEASAELHNGVKTNCVLLPVTYKTHSWSLAVTSQYTLCMRVWTCMKTDCWLEFIHPEGPMIGQLSWGSCGFFSVMLMLSGYPNCKLHLYVLEPSETVRTDDLTPGYFLWNSGWLELFQSPLAAWSLCTVLGLCHHKQCL